MSLKGRILNRLVSIVATCNTWLQKGYALHCNAIKSGLECDTLLMNSIITMYFKCHQWQYAQHVFDNMPQRDPASWNCLISGYAKCGCSNEALNCFALMRRAGFVPTHFSLASLLDACTNLGISAVAEQLHALVIVSGLDQDVRVATSLVHFYGKFNRMKDACFVFDTIARDVLDTAAFNSLIAGFRMERNHAGAVRVFQDMTLLGVSADRITLSKLLEGLEPLNLGRQVHSHIVKLGFESDCQVGTSLAAMYGYCGYMDDAIAAFSAMAELDLVSCTAVMGHWAQGGHPLKAFWVFGDMLVAGLRPDAVTFATALGICLGPEFLRFGRLIHAMVLKNQYQYDVCVGSSLISMYSRSNHMKDACLVFQRMMNCRHLFPWTALLSGYVHNGLCEDALQVFHGMLQVGIKPDNVTLVAVLTALKDLPILELGMQLHGYLLKVGFCSDVSAETALLTMYAHCSRVDYAREVFTEIQDIRDFPSWSAMLAAYAQQGFGQEALELVHDMHRLGLKLNDFIFSTALMACSSLSAISQGELLHALILKSGYSSQAFIGSAMIDMYAKCGRIEDSKCIFTEIPKDDVALYNAMISAYDHHGCVTKALAIFEELQNEGIRPDGVSFVAIISACSHTRLVKEGLHYFDLMWNVYGISPTMEHYACMVDLLGRAGHLEEAFNLVASTPGRLNITILKTLLVACKNNGNMDVGKQVVKLLFETDHQDNCCQSLLKA